MTDFRELKRHLNKPDEIYVCDLLCRGTDWVILRYVSKRDWTVSKTHLPSGTTTLAFYRAQANFVLWRFVDLQGQLKGHLFHICSELEVRTDEVSYLDLLLDVWVDVQGNAEILDEEELHACVVSGKMSKKQANAITGIGLNIKANWTKLVGEWTHYYDLGLGPSIQGIID